MREKEDAQRSAPRRRRGWLRRLVKLALVLCLLLGGVAMGFAVVSILNAPDLDMLDVAPDGYRSVVLDDEGNEILKLVGAESNRVYVTLDQIPQNLIDAVVSIEDERFWDHHGIDLRGIARAMVVNITHGSMSQGASTITQQLIKNNVFAAGMEEKTVVDKLRRKVQEQYLAVKLELQADKDWILENYLNTINLGGGTWGVSTAAQRYFGKAVGELTLSECAVLAGITKSPTYYNPLKNPDNNAVRRQQVLAKMLELGHITQAEHDEALADDVYARIDTDHTAGVDVEVLSYFEDAMIYEVLEDLMAELSLSEDDAWQMIYRGGITICSTQSTRLQTICEQAINDDSRYSDDQQATAVIIDPATGYVKAIVGGRGEKTGSLTWNRATSSVRQPGSTIKVVAEYAAALDSGAITLGSVFDDAPTTYSNGTPIRNAGGTYAGRITVRRAIASSTNTVALRCFQDVGMDRVWSTLRKFGFQHLTDADRVEALALGGTSGGVTNLEMTAAYAAIANGGEYTQPTYYTQIFDRQGNLLLENRPSRSIAVSQDTAALLTLAMEEVLTTGTGTTASFSGVPLAGKSGTTTDARDVWFVGFSPYYACGVWGGYDDNGEQAGSGYVRKLWRDVMQQAHTGLSGADFARDGLVERTICTKCGALAVAGLCDSTVQGNMTCAERFVDGTEPTERCTCHTAVSVCAASGQRAGTWCPEDEVTTAVYLFSGTAGTADESAVLPQLGAEETCQVHSSWWNQFFPDRDPDDGEEEKPWTPSRPTRPTEPDSPDVPEEPDTPSTPADSGVNWLDPSTWWNLITGGGH